MFQMQTTAQVLIIREELCISFSLGLIKNETILLMLNTSVKRHDLLY